MNSSKVVSAIVALCKKIPSISTDILKAEAEAAMDDLLNKVNSDFIKVGEITFDDLNGAGTGTTITTVFSGGKPVNKLFKTGFIKVITPLVSYTGKTLDVSQNIVTAGGQTDAVQDVSAKIKFGGGVANPQDWTAGKLAIYIVADQISITE